MKVIPLLFVLFLVSCATHKNVVSDTEPQVVIEKSEKGAQELIVSEYTYNFPLNSSQLSTHDEKTLLKISSEIASQPELYKRVEVVGHSDQAGSEDQNLDISKKRAMRVLELMKEAGIDKKRIRASWLAATEPVENESEISSKNRRVEIKTFRIKNR